MCRQGLDTLQYMHALQIFPCDTTTVERQNREKQGLTGHYHSTPVTLISWWASSLHCPSLPVPFSISTYPCLHQFPLTAWFCLSGEQTRIEKRRQTETQRDREKARDDKNKRGTKMDRGMEAEKEKEERGEYFSRIWKAFVITGPLAMLILAKRLWSDDTQWKCFTLYMLLILFSLYIPLSSSSLSYHFHFWSVNLPLLFSSSSLLLFALIFKYFLPWEPFLYILLLIQIALFTFPPSVLLPQSSLRLLIYLVGSSIPPPPLYYLPLPLAPGDLNYNM